MSDKRIAVFFPNMVDGGAERVTLNLIRRLARDYDYPIDLVLASATGAFMEQVPDNVRVIDLKAGRMIASIPGLVRYLRKERPHAILSGMDYVNVTTLISKKLAMVKTRTVVCLHINLSAQLANPVYWRAKFVVPFIKLTHPGADVIVATSKGCGDDFLKVTGVGEKNMELIYNPTITDELLPLAAEKVEHKWFEEGAPPVILAVGRLVQQKNFELLLKSFAELRKNRDVRLLILGEGAKRSELEALVAELEIQDHVDMPGFVSNPYAYMSKSAMLVLSSHYEALPAVLIEALHIGTPIVATNCPNGPEEILENGKYGELVPVDDVPALAAAMQKTLDNKAFKKHEEACQRYIDKNVVKQYLKVLIGPEYNAA